MPASAASSNRRPPAQVLRGRRVVTPTAVRPAAVHIVDGVIAAVTPWDEVPAGAEVVDAGDDVVLPGLVDTHVHCNQPGRTEWEGFATATAAAAAGGVTTVVDMPLNSVPATTSVAALEAKRAAAQGQLRVDAGFWGGVVPGNEGELAALWEAGVLGFKCFLAPSGVEEFGHVGEADLHRVLPVLAALDAPLLVHAELPAELDRAAAALPPNADPCRHATWLATRPAAAELAAIELVLRLAARYGARVHVVHLAAAGALGVLRQARRQGVRVTVETCPHYLTFAAEEIADGATDHKCAPPLRERANGELLWTALLAGDVDLVASDHSPCPPAMKLPGEGDFLRAWGGIASLELGLAAVWSGLVARDPALAAGETAASDAALLRLARWLSAAPAELAGLAGRKGRIAPGCDADLVVWDPSASFTVDPARLQQRHPITPYAGRTLRGLVRATYQRRHRVHPAVEGDSPRGRPLARPLR
jgi:allantoinase